MPPMTVVGFLGFPNARTSAHPRIALHKSSWRQESLKTFGDGQMSGPMVLIHTKPIGAQKCCKGPQVEDFLMASSEEPLFWEQQRTRSGLTLLQMSLSTKDQNQIQHSFDIPITVAPNEIKNEYGYGEYSGIIH